MLRYKLNPQLRLLSEQDHCFLLNPFSGQWFRLVSKAFYLLKHFLEFQNLEYVLLLFNDAETKEFLDYLINKGLLVEEGYEAITQQILFEPTFAYLNITDRCNLNCPMCYFEAKHFISTAEIDFIPVMTKLKSLGIKQVRISGGEPLLRADIEEILRQARLSFERVELNTNGLLLDNHLEAVVAYTDQVKISLDGASACVHDRIRGEGSFVKTIANIKQLKAKGFNHIVVAPTLTRLNKNDFENVVALAKQLDVELNLGVFACVGRGLCNKMNVALGINEVIAVFERLFELYGHQNNPQIKELEIKLRCQAGKTLISLGPDGSVYPCHLMHQPEFRLGHIRSINSWQEVAEQSLVLQKLNQATCENKTVCSSCRWRYFCGGGCLAQAYFSSGDLMGLDPNCTFYQNFLGEKIWSQS